MLSAKKIRIHGMRSGRWTTKDKISQYKGLINLYIRDRKILTFDYNVNRKRVNKELKNIRNEIEENRSDLDNVITGNRQLLRNTLSDHTDLQIAFQNQPPSRVIDHLHQGNFNKRKYLDRMNYQMKQKTEKLVYLKLEAAELEDRLKFESLAEVPYEKESQIVTGKVQDAFLKKEAALTVKQTYMTILNILKKDAIYYDVVLNALKLDGDRQNKCMKQTTELGQLATEYLDDRKHEFRELDKAIKRDMKTREQSLKVTREEVANLINNMGLLLRFDDDVNTGRVVIPKTMQDFNLQKDIESITELLKFLQNTTFVSNFDCIFPCLKEQEDRKNKLKELLEKTVNDQNNMIKKRNHADAMRNQLTNTMIETTMEYTHKKKEFLIGINKESQDTRERRKVYEQKCDLLVKVRSSLHQLARQCLLIRSKVDEKLSRKDTPRYPFRPFGEGTSKLIIPTNVFVTTPPDFEEDGLHIIADLIVKLQILMNNTLPKPLEGVAKDKGMKFIFQLTSGVSSFVEYEEDFTEESLIDTVFFEDPQVPTYSDIKAKSKEIVETCTINEDLIPLFIPKKKTNFK